MFKLINNQKRFWYQLDNNLDGSFTISDLPALLKQIYFLPGDLVYYFFFQIPQYVPETMQYFMVGIKFFEIESINDLYGNFLSGLFSFFVWLFIFLIFYAIYASYWGD